MIEKQNAWRKSYTWLLIANAIYIFIFFIIMLLFS